ncbi:pleurocidin-like peptide WF3, partial [Lates japonicus]
MVGKGKPLAELRYFFCSNYQFVGRMKLAMTFLVLTLVVLMAEPGECGLWGRLKAVWRGAKAAWK